MKKIILAVAASALIVAACNNTPSDPAATAPVPVKIVSLNGTVSEVLSGLNMESNIVGVDVTSVYPENLKEKTQMGSSHSYNIEGIIAAAPDYVICTQERGLSPEQVTQLQQAGLKVWVLSQEYSVAGTKKLINELADSFKKQEEAKHMIAKIDTNLAAAKATDTRPKVIFIYARGAGTLQVAGNGTPMNEMIKLANGEPAATDFNGFKPLTAEAMVAANPDYILLFDTGLKSLEGAEGVLKVPGVANTNAGKNKGIIEMDGLKLSGFGPRVGEAVKELSEKLHP